MKTITINVSETVYHAYQSYARRVDRKTSELIRSAMEEYQINHLRPKNSLRELRPLSVGRLIEPITDKDDLLGEMLDATRS